MENPLYLSIIAGIKSFKPELYVPPEPKAEGEFMAGHEHGDMVTKYVLAVGEMRVGSPT